MVGVHVRMLQLWTRSLSVEGTPDPACRYIV